MERVYSVKDLKNIFLEEKNEFKPVFGDGVESTNKKNNDKSYKDSKTRTGAIETPKKKKATREGDRNRTTLDYDFDVDPGKEYKERIHAQAEGYTSKLEKSNKIEKTGEFNDDLYQSSKKTNDELSKHRKTIKKSGLQAKELPDEIFDKKNMYESKTMKTVRFKNTAFLTEEHMISRIPDEMKREGNIFKMKDKNDNTYIVEWKTDAYNKTSNAIILEHINDKKVNETLDRIKELYGFKLSEKYSRTTGQERIYESNDALASTLETMRKIIK